LRACHSALAAGKKRGCHRERAWETLVPLTSDAPGSSAAWKPSSTSRDAVVGDKALGSDYHVPCSAIKDVKGGNGCS
jgi:hypothetical protein